MLDRGVVVLDRGVVVLDRGVVVLDRGVVVLDREGIRLFEKDSPPIIEDLRSRCGAAGPATVAALLTLRAADRPVCMPLMTKKLLAIAAPAAIFLASQSAFAGGAMAAPAAQVQPIATPAPLHVNSHAFAAFATFLKSAATAAMTQASAPMTGDDGCPLAGNVGKGSQAGRCAMRTAVAKAGDAK